MDKIIDILDSIAYEKGLKIENVEEALKESLIQTAKKMIDSELEYDAEIDRENKKLKLFQKIVVLENDDPKLSGLELDEYENPISAENFISLDEAKEVDPDLEIGDTLQYDLEFEDMGRNAATILMSNLEYKLQRFIENNLFSKYQAKIGTIISAMVTSVDRSENTFVEFSEVRGMMPRKNRIKGETFKVGDVVKAVVRAVKIDKTHGLIVELSRTSPKFLEALLALEVPELKDGRVIVESCARIPGSRAKIALSTNEMGVDPIGSVVGVKGVRISAVSEELHGENIDCVDYSPIPEMFISRALSPAMIKSVKIEKPIKFDEENGSVIEKGKAIVTISSDQKSKAIGKAGLNIRLTSMLTKYDIELNEVESDLPSGSDSMNTSEEKNTDTSSLEALFK